MIAIVDGGSTKCDWVILKASGEEVLRTTTKGFNPNNTAAHLIPVEINKNEDLEKNKRRHQICVFYGSGWWRRRELYHCTRTTSGSFTKADILLKKTF